MIAALDPFRADAAIEASHFSSLSLIHADVVKLSDEDLAWMAPGEQPEAVAAAWLKTGPALVIVTQGAAGATAYFGGRTLRQPAAAAARIADAIGAGDAFMAALLAGLRSRQALTDDRLRAASPDLIADILAHAARAAAIAVSRPGADPPWAHEM